VAPDANKNNMKVSECILETDVLLNIVSIRFISGMTAVYLFLHADMLSS